MTVENILQNKILLIQYRDFFQEKEQQYQEHDSNFVKKNYFMDWFIQQ
jgi:hypothetical protein